MSDTEQPQFSQDEGDTMEWDYSAIGEDNEIDNFYFDHSLLEQAYRYTQSESQVEEEWSYTFEEEETEITSIDSNRKEQKHVYIIPHDEKIKKTPCAIVVYTDGKPSRCGADMKNQRGLSQLFGTWEIDVDAVKSVDKSLSKLGVCQNHFLYDQNRLHPPGAKAERSTDKSKITYRKCLFCHMYKYFFTRGDNCAIHHQFTTCNRNVQVTCRGLFTCPALKECAPYVKTSSNTNTERRRFVCDKCFGEQGGHLHQRPGRGRTEINCTGENLHVEDTTKALQKVAHFLQIAASSDDVAKKEHLLKMLVPVMQRWNDNGKQQNAEDTKEPDTVPTLFTFNTIMRLNRIGVSEAESRMKVTAELCTDFGESMAVQLWNSREELKQRKHLLQSPESLEEYESAMPTPLLAFFKSFIRVLQQKKLAIANKKRLQRGLAPASLKENVVTKITLFLVSILLTVAFRSWKIWLTNTISSLCRRPKLISSLQEILHVAHVASYGRKHQVQVENQQMTSINPRDRLMKVPAILEASHKIWNLAIIDNIDFKAKTFAYGNIFDAVRKSSHATLRMVFQFCMPTADNFLIPPRPVHEQLPLGFNRTTTTWKERLPEIISTLIRLHGRRFNIEDINRTIKQYIPPGFENIDPPNVVILEAGEQPNSDGNVHKACDMYLNDLEAFHNGNTVLDVACDEAIFRRLTSYKNNQQKIRAILGQWHTSKDMCAVITTIFSGYGLFGIAASLGVKYLDKLQQAVDYQATFHTLELVWASVAIAICWHIEDVGMSMDDIENCNNNVLKVWYLFFCWAGWLKLHKLGIRMGNFNLQIECLRAFAPLFPVAGKSNYATSVTRFLATVHDNPELQYYMQNAASVNLTDHEHYLGYDEALERFGVKFVKQTIVGNAMDEENLKNNIRSAQTIHERLNTVLSEFINDATISKGTRALKTRQEAMWKTADLLLRAFKASTPEQHELFRATTQLTQTGYEHLFTCYDKGLDRLRAIERQDVRALEDRVAKGRRMKNVVPMTAKEHTQLSKGDQSAGNPEPLVYID
jgi:hypothetical protein